MTNFGSTKIELNMKYRLGLEHALAKADFLNVPDLVLVQAFTIFLFLVRRHDSPRFVWMMTGLAIRMGQALGLQRDGAHFEHLSPYEVEMRRRVWWSLCMLDMRASEDQGMEYTISLGSHDTKLPLNINDADIDPKTAKAPTEREGITDMTFPLISIDIGNVAKQMMALSSQGGAPSIEEQNRLINEMYQILDRRFLQYSVESGNILYWVQVCIVRLVMAKMSLFIYLPLLFSSPSDNFSDKIKTKLLIAAIEVAEYNHALNEERRCRQWRWVYQTYIHWHAVVYILIELSRRSWSPIIERAWVALHSPWLIPVQSNMDKNQRIWFPLKKLMAKAKKHRENELERLRRDPQAVKWLEIEDQRIPAPGSPGPFPAGSNAVELFHQHWRQLVAMPEEPGLEKGKSKQYGPVGTSPSAHPSHATWPGTSPSPANNEGGSGPNTTYESPYFGASDLRTSQKFPTTTSPNFQTTITTSAPENSTTEQTAEPSYNALSDIPVTWSMGPGLDHWLWADADPSVNVFANMDFDANDVNMDVDGEMDWYNWVESAKGMEWNTGQNGSGLA
jgi:Fungal specific transcription factor domain